MTRSAALWSAGVIGVLALLVTSGWLVMLGEPSQVGVQGLLALSAHEPALDPGTRQADVVRIAYRPLLVPSAHVVEVMRRDRVLARDAAAVRMSVRFLPCISVATEVAAFDREVDGAVLGSADAPGAVEKGDGRVVSQFPLMGFSMVCRGAHRVADLAGARIGFVPDTSAEFLTRRALAQAGLTASAVTLVPHPGPDLLRSLVAGEIDAFGAMEPTPTLALRNVPELASVGHWSLDLDLVLSRRLIESRRPLVLSILASQIRALHWLRISGKNLHRASGWVRKTQMVWLEPGLVADLFDYNRLASTSITSAYLSLEKRSAPASTDQELADELNFASTHALIPPGASRDRAFVLQNTTLLAQILAQPAGYALGQFDVQEEPF